MENKVIGFFIFSVWPWQHGQQLKKDGVREATNLS